MFALVGFELAQLASLVFLLQSIAAKRAVTYVSKDLVLYSWVWTASYTISSVLYTCLTTVSAQYAARFPLHPVLHAMKLLAGIQFASCLASCGLMYQMFYKYRRKEPVSVVCGLVLGMCALVVLRFGWLCYMGRATINLLDMADLLNNVGSVAFAVRFVPQVSVNWFLDHGAPLHRHFFVLQALSLVAASLALAYLHYTLPWHDVPLNLPTCVGVMLNWGQLALLLFQRLHYRLRRPAPGEV